MDKSNDIFIDIAIKYAWKFQALSLPNPSVAALIVYKNKIIALNSHIIAGSPHAEVLALKNAFLYFLKNDRKKRNKILKNIIKYGIKKGFLLQNMQGDKKSYIETKKMSKIDSKIGLSVESSGKSRAKFSEDSKKLNNIESKKQILKKLINRLENLQDSKDIHNFISKFHNKIFKKCEIYITLEPCNHYGKTPPCAKLLKKIKPKKIIVATSEQNKAASGGFERLRMLNIIKNVEEKRASDLIYPFKEMLCNKGFLLFKIASRLNGDYKNGSISNLDSKIYNSNMRSIADFIVISGETLRNDNPLLDTRYATLPYKKSKKLPKIFVLSKNIKSIESYNIKDREVSIIDSIDKIPKEGFGIIEGGFNLLANLLNMESKKDSKNLPKIGAILGYIAPFFMQDSMQNLTQNFSQDSMQLLNNFYLAHIDILDNFWQEIFKEDSNKIIESKLENLELLQAKNIIYWLLRKDSLEKI